MTLTSHSRISMDSHRMNSHCMNSHRMNLHRFFSPAVCAVFLFAPSLPTQRAQAQTPATTAAVTEYVKAEMQRQHIPGLSLLVVKSGKIVRAEGFGLANVELQVPVKPE